MDASIAADAINFRYPVSNILHGSVYIKWQSTSVNDTIRLQWTQDITVDSIALAGHNGKTVRVRLYEEGDDPPVEDLMFHDLLSTDIVYFSQVYTTIRRATVLIDSKTSEQARCGYLSIGEYLQVDNPLINYNNAFSDTSLMDKSHGFITGVEGVVLSSVNNLDLYDISRQDVNNIKAMYENVHTFRPLFVDITEYDHGAFEPIFCNLGPSFNANRYARGYSRWMVTGLQLEEVK